MVSETTLTKWHSRNKKSYVNKGYVFTKYGDEFKVKVEDLTEGSHAEIICLCDYCLSKRIKTIIKKEYRAYLKENKKSIIHKDCCKKCQVEKVKESNLEVYGVEDILCLSETKEKIKLTNLAKYGVGSYAQTKEYRNKTTQTNLKKYGVKYISQSETIKTKIINTNLRKYGVEWFCELFDNQDKNHPNWKGGISNLAKHLRNSITQWKNDSINNCGYKCVITSDRFDIVHHLYGFNNIVFETLESLNLPLYQQINEYTQEELQSIEEKCLELHYKYGLGVCLCKEAHDKFHIKYGKGDNTKEQFEEFKLRYQSGEFDEHIKLNQVQLPTAI